MKIVTSTIQKVWIPESDDLDPITVYLENYEPGRGKITIECWGKAWSAAWPAMSKRSIEQFFIDTGVPYLVGCLAPGVESEVLNPDLDELRAKVCRDIFSRRRTHHFDKDMRRELYEQAQVLEISSNDCSDYELMAAVYGCEWWRDGPDELKVPNQQYVHLCRVIEAVKEGLKAYIHQQAETKNQGAKMGMTAEELAQALDINVERVEKALVGLRAKGLVVVVSEEGGAVDEEKE
ncbi:hypothetical protein JFQ88_004132 [Aeromonas dhakensis]|nr:hypothetical protein [Aeromonas dhakensis]